MIPAVFSVAVRKQDGQASLFHVSHIEIQTHEQVMALVRETYQRLFNSTPNSQVIHAGLECGLFKKPYPDMDMVSIGPTITGPHSPDEQVHIESVGHYWTLLTELLKAIPAK